MSNKRFLTVALIFTDAPNLEAAEKMADKYVGMRNGSALVLDESIPTVEVDEGEGKEYLRSVKDLPPTIYQKIFVDKNQKPVILHP